ncbi:glycoside hydrolase family protein [Acinetobacter baumannii]|uniref:glycoside hydrolase family protein n=1 Tax=Acinetobacter baumannii TaxID=470 RepID=UPI00062C5CB4|nr:glycoside hydrolase family protein [Acinetobacter baumannii]KKZ46572.1 lysozyme [Acinetobacter baumannii]MCF4430199.1 glycoside hydrolase family protein [Acinetobacter baumannii]MCF4452930.1 glycoside hydrolase family protein [Acinetobacter baumannii]MCF4490856.1 glycoside hydrolase family protein [Acinetobacter baumannii]MCF4530502.1 glycoside hydrolase family protein [Acinetobacter baumannii]
MSNKTKYAVAILAASAAFFTSLINYEGFTSSPVIPVKGDKPTIGIGSTKYENGTPVKMTDKPISKERAVQIAKAHISKDEAYFRSSLSGVKLSQVEYDLYLDFMYQFGQSAWSGSSMRRLILQGQPRQACDALLKWKYVAKRDCSIRKNDCYGVWTRQLERHAKCIGAQ